MDIITVKPDGSDRRLIAYKKFLMVSSNENLRISWIDNHFKLVFAINIRFLDEGEQFKIKGQNEVSENKLIFFLTFHKWNDANQIESAPITVEWEKDKKKYEFTYLFKSLSLAKDKSRDFEFAVWVEQKISYDDRYTGKHKFRF